MRRTVPLLAVLFAVAAFFAWATCGGPDVGGPVSPTVPAPDIVTRADDEPIAEPTKPQPKTPRPRARAADASALPDSPAAATHPVELRIRVLRVDGSAAVGATVTVAPGFRTLLASGPPVTIESGGPKRGPVATDAAGRAAVSVEPRSTHIVDARLGLEIARVVFDVGEGAAELEVRLIQGFLVSGAVRTPSGDAAAGATVSVHVYPDLTSDVWLAARAEYRRGVLDYADVITGPDGRFEAGPVARKNASDPIYVVAERADLLPADVTLGPADATHDVVLTLREAVGLRGRVLDEKGKPVADTWLLFHDGAYGDEQRIETGQDGRFAARMVPTALGDLIFVTHGFVVRRIPSALSAAGDRDLGDVVVQRGGTIHGTVVGENGSPVARPHVGVLSVDLGVAICEANIGPGATFEGWRVGPGAHVLYVHDLPPPGVGGAWDPVEVRACFAGAERLRIVVIDGPGVLVRLHAAGDAPDAAPRAFNAVRVGASKSPGGAKSPVWGSDRVAVHSIRVPAPPGAEIDIEVTSDDYETCRVERVRVGPGRATVVDVTLVAISASPAVTTPRHARILKESAAPESLL
ncbi:MAG: hypothetical protein K8T90_19470 [Planctomycetes bacterium]|nr:hypothetical protein [Planctomycetota bacterium]